MVIDDTVSVEGIYAFIYCTKWRSGQVLPMPHSLTDRLTTLKDRATQLLIKYKSGALVKQQGGIWQPFDESKNGHEIYVMRVFAVFATIASFLHVIANLYI